MLIEPSGTLNTGNAGGAHTDTVLEWIQSHFTRNATRIQAQLDTLHEYADFVPSSGKYLILK